MSALATLLTLAMTAATTEPTYVALGDSTGVGVGARHGGGYPDRLAARSRRGGRPLRLVNLCVSGATVADLAAGQLEPALAARPAVFTLGIGINDVMRGTQLASFARDYERVAAALAGTGAEVLVVNVPDLARSPLALDDEARRALHARVEGVNACIAETARRHGFALVDLYGATAPELSRDGELLSEDRFHPSDLGYERWTDVVAPAFAQALSAAEPGGRLPPPRALR